MRILILEDDIERQKSFARKLTGVYTEIVDNCNRAIDLLQKLSWDCLLLDHDLENKQFVPSGLGTGYEVACWLEQNPEKQPKIIIVHSLNWAGAQNICRALPDAMYFPSCWDFVELREILYSLVEKRQ